MFNSQCQLENGAHKHCVSMFMVPTMVSIMNKFVTDRCPWRLASRGLFARLRNLAPKNWHQLLDTLDVSASPLKVRQGEMYGGSEDFCKELNTASTVVYARRLGQTLLKGLI